MHRSSTPSLRTDSGLYRQIPQKYFAKSDIYGYSHSVPDVLALLAVLHWMGTSGIVASLMLAPVTALIGYRLTFVVHDCSHSTLFSSRHTNTAMGWLCAGILFTSFPTFRRLHSIHHSFFREENDPQGEDYNGFTTASPGLLWHIAKPLFFFNVLEKVSNSIALNHCGLTAAEKEAGKVRIESVSQRRSLGPLLNIVAIQTLLVVIASDLFSSYYAYPVFALSLVSIGLFLSRVRSYLEHGNLTADDGDYRVARTHKSNLLESNVLCGLNFNFHHEHHLWPQVPSCLLPQVHADYTAGKIPDIDFETSYWRSLRKLLRNYIGKGQTSARA